MKHSNTPNHNIHAEEITLLPEEDNLIKSSDLINMGMICQETMEPNEDYSPHQHLTD